MSSPTYQSAKLVRGKVARVTLLDACGVPVATNSSHVSKGIITVTGAKNMDEGDEIKTRQMDGTIGTYEPGRRTMLNYMVTAQFITADPGVLAMITGDAVVLNAAGTKIVGFIEEALIALTQNFALEVWTDSSGQPCVAGGKPIGYMLYPLLSQGYVTIDNIEDKEVTFTVTAESYPNAGWGKGPYMPVLDVAGTAPARLAQPVTAREQRHFEITTVAAPAPTGGAGPVSITLPSPY